MGNWGSLDFPNEEVQLSEVRRAGAIAPGRYRKRFRHSVNPMLLPIRLDLRIRLNPHCLCVRPTFRARTSESASARFRPAFSRRVLGSKQSSRTRPLLRQAARSIHSELHCIAQRHPEFRSRRETPIEPVAPRVPLESSMNIPRAARSYLSRTRRSHDRTSNSRQPVWVLLRLEY